MTQQKVIEIALEHILMNPNQPRNHFAWDELEELAQSIRSVGLLHPPLVRPSKQLQGKYELIAGERRYRAAALAGMEKIPVVVIEPEVDYSAEASLVENIQRVDLNPMEIAQALKYLIVERDLSQEELAQRIGKKRSTIANYLRLLTLPYVIQESLRMEKITMGHAKALLALESFEKQLEVHTQIIEKKLSVREVEKIVQGQCAPPQELSRTQSDCFVQDVEERLQKKLGTKVVIVSYGKRGKIMIDYYSLDDLDRVLELLG